MTKRARGSARSAQRPQGRNAGTRAKGRPGPRATPRPAAPSELEAAAEIADDVVDDRPAAAADELRAARSTPGRARTRTSSLLATRAATEYVYVAQDVRRIAAVAALLFGTMLVLWVLIVVARVIPV